MARVSSRWLLWRLPALVACAAALVLTAGFWLGLRGTLGERMGEPAPAPASPRPAARREGERLLLVVGDSLARGTGDESGRGFSGDVFEALQRRGAARMANLGVNGAESADVRAVAQTPNVRTLAASADVILLSAGGNDLSHSVTRDLRSPAETAAAMDRAREAYVANLRAILKGLREASPKTPIYVIGLYDPFGMQGPEGRLGRSVILGWNGLVAETALAFPGVHVVPTSDLFDGRPDRLSADRFHPNRKGYALIAERVVQLLPE
ncbi:MAG: GDSL-type esterase/lipase family protein [Thermoanaerobaculia bacterium]